MAKMIFQASCPECGEARKFIEFKAEPCTPGPDTPPPQYGFRCMVCKTIVPELTDEAGVHHAWQDGKHLETPKAA